MSHMVKAEMEGLRRSLKRSFEREGIGIWDWGFVGGEERGASSVRGEAEEREEGDWIESSFCVLICMGVFSQIWLAAQGGSLGAR